MKARSKKKKGQKKVTIFLLFIVPPLLIFLYFFIKTWLIYPSFNKYKQSPKTYVEKGSILEGAHIALQVVEHGSRQTPKIALTFDADMTPGMRFLLDKRLVKSWYNKEIKTILDQEKTPATIFLGGLWTKTYPLDARDLATDPLIEIGNHSYNHYAFTQACFGLPNFVGSKKDDVKEAQKIIQETTGVTPKYFRFPGGCYERIDLQTVSSLGLEIVHWDVVAGDGFNHDANSIVRNVETRVQNGSIIVLHLHDGSLAPKTAEALRKIIPDLKKRGFQFVKLSMLLR